MGVLLERKCHCCRRRGKGACICETGRAGRLVSGATNDTGKHFGRGKPKRHKPMRSWGSSI